MCEIKPNITHEFSHQIRHHDFNIIERLMGEISKEPNINRCDGPLQVLEAILNIILTSYVSEKSYQKFKHQMVMVDNLRSISG